MSKSLLVIGAGPAGMMAAGTAAQYGTTVTLADKNKRVGRKLLVTGKGRCNITNNCDENTFIQHVPTNGRFLYSAIYGFNPQDTMTFFENNGLPLKTERGNRVFPCSDKAMDVVDTMHKFIKQSGCKFLQSELDTLMIEDQCVKGAIAKSGKKFFADKVLIACGGKSYPLTGSTGQGYALACQGGHSIITPKPSLVSLVSPDDCCKEMQGLSLRNISLSVLDKQKGEEVYHDFGELLFTHYGVSGPVVLSASAHMRNMQNTTYQIAIDLKPALTEEQLDKRLQRDFINFQNKDIINSLHKLLPSTMIPVIIQRAKIDFETKCHSITRIQRHNLVNVLKKFTIDICDFRPIEEAIITSGGVSVKEINPKTMESKLVKNLYFAGEVIDVDAYTGGFNLQIAFSTGYLAGSQIGLAD